MTSAPAIIASWKPNARNLVEDGGFVGGKARGVFRLPNDWVPPFLVLTKVFFESWTRGSSAAEIFADLSTDAQALINEFVDRVVPTFQPRRTRVVVRSNSPLETLLSRGSFDSFPAEPTREAVADAVDRLFASAESAAMYALIQVAIEPGIAGHMSNERRVSRRKNLWLVEELTPAGQEVEQQVIQGTASDWEDHGQLLASNESELRNVLRRAAGFLTNTTNGRFHCEWVWSGQRVWIVQADEADPSPSNAIVESYLNGVEPLPPDFKPQSALRHFRDVASGKWKKLRRPRIFTEVGIPHADVFVLPGDEWSKQDLFARGSLQRDFEIMCQYPVVIRCDIADGVAIDETLLPTSPALTNAREAVRFLDGVAAEFKGKGLKPADWAVLPAFLVPARASAMVHARPRSQRIQVDAIWGFPDGLLHFPHDRWFYYPGTDETIEHRRHKSHCLLLVESKWETHELGPPFDWQSVLDAEEVTTVANWALQIANKLGREVQLMALARIGGRRGASACLPWHYTEWKVPKYRKSLLARPYSTRIALVTSPDDLDGLEEHAICSPNWGLLVRPSPEWRRKPEFLERVATVAAEREIPIYFEGSLLGHAYYIMHRTGAMVIPVLDEEPKDKAKVYNKLVRDRIPVIIRQAGGLARVRKLSGAHAIALLRQKLIEEAIEVWNAEETDIGEELADVLDVVEALREQVGITPEKLRSIGDNKRSKRGGFEQMLFLEQTTIESLRGKSDRQKQFPQFVEDDVVLGRRKTTMRHFRIVANTDPRDLLTVEALLVPPVDASVEAEAVEIETENLEVSVKHVDNKLVVRLSRPAPMVNPNQRLLFPEMEDGEAEHE